MLNESNLIPIDPNNLPKNQRIVKVGDKYIAVGVTSVNSVNGKTGEVILTPNDLDVYSKTEVDTFNGNFNRDLNILLDMMDYFLGINMTVICLYIEKRSDYSFKYKMPESGSGTVVFQTATQENPADRITLYESDLPRMNEDESEFIDKYDEFNEITFKDIAPGAYYIFLSGNMTAFNFTTSTEEKDDELVYFIAYFSYYIDDATNMFRNCKSLIQLSEPKLPEYLVIGDGMFEGCDKLELSIDDLANNAPKGGYKIKSAVNMFSGCSSVTGSRSKFLKACPLLENSEGMFLGTNTTD